MTVGGGLNCGGFGGNVGVLVGDVITGVFGGRGGLTDCGGGDCGSGSGGGGGWRS
jgi:hypothetical protein